MVLGLVLQSVVVHSCPNLPLQQPSRLEVWKKSQLIADLRRARARVLALACDRLTLKAATNGAWSSKPLLKTEAAHEAQASTLCQTAQRQLSGLLRTVSSSSAFAKNCNYG